MKLMIAKCCGEIVVPNSIPKRPRMCECGQSAVWWDDPQTGALAVWRFSDSYPMPEVLGIHNTFLEVEMSRLGLVDKSQIDTIVEGADGYLFKTLHSPIVRVSPTSKTIKDVRVASTDDLATLLNRVLVRR